MRVSKNKELVLAAVVLILSLLLTCKTKDPLNYETKPLEGKIIFNIAEGIPDNEPAGTPRMVLSMHTEKVYGCINYKLATKISRSRTDILVFLSHVYIENICFTALGPARFQAPLGLTDGTYLLVISNRENDDRYEVRVTGSTIEIIEKESHFTIPEQKI
jgi:hypothetical protein